MAPHENLPATGTNDSANEDRRQFLAVCGKFAVITPPALTLLLSTSLNSPAIAQSSGNHNRGHGGEDCDRDRRPGDYR